MAKIPFGAFRQIFAVCCAHNLFAIGKQIPHLQPEMCFVHVHAAAKNDFYGFAAFAANSAKLFLQSEMQDEISSCILCYLCSR